MGHGVFTTHSPTTPNLSYTRRGRRGINFTLVPPLRVTFIFFTYMEHFPQNKKERKNLETLRGRLRGDDRAVVETGSNREQEKLLDILKNSTQHSHDELLYAIFTNYSGEAYGDYQWEKKMGGWTTPEELTLYGKLRESHLEFAQLSFDFGFMTHLPEFMKMLKQGEIQSTNYLDARSELKEKLGYKIFWRGTMLTDEEIESIKKMVFHHR